MSGRERAALPGTPDAAFPAVPRRPAAEPRGASFQRSPNPNPPRRTVGSDAAHFAAARVGVGRAGRRHGDRRWHALAGGARVVAGARAAVEGAAAAVVLTGARGVGAHVSLCTQMGREGATRPAARPACWSPAWRRCRVDRPLTTPHLGAALRVANARPAGEWARGGPGAVGAGGPVSHAGRIQHATAGARMLRPRANGGHAIRGLDPRAEHRCSARPLPPSQQRGPA